MKKIIEVTNLDFGYSKDKKIIDNLSFCISEGEKISIIGHNGSGKSTLAMLLDGLLSPQSGVIKIDGIILEEKNIKDMRKIISIVFQNPDNQFIGSTVEDDVAFGLENRNIPREEMKKLVSEYLNKVHMSSFSNVEPSFLSGGQKERVAIAGALVLNPKILILDEATSMLDPRNKKDVFDLINNLKKMNKELTIISITHDMEEAYFSDRIMLLEKGKIVFFDTPKKLFENNDLLVKHNLFKPFLPELISELIKNHIDVNYSMDLNEVLETLCRLK